jgi:multiple sugar transport system substrate-binding protein
MTSAASELRFQRLIGNLPARASAWNAPQLADPALAPFAAQMRQPAITPAIVEMERIKAEVQLIAERVVRELLTLDEGVRAMDARADAILTKRRALVDAGRIA